jgi:hypothetical protein
MEWRSRTRFSKRRSLQNVRQANPGDDDECLWQSADVTGAQQIEKSAGPARRRGGAARVWDRLSLIPSVAYQLLVVGGVWLVGALGGMAFDGCGPGGDSSGSTTVCEVALAGTAWYIMLALVAASIVATIAIGIVFWARGRLVWPIAAAGAVLATLALLAEILIQDYASRPR